jgi:RNA polymerase sporulation-specific sigma factor
MRKKTKTIYKTPKEPQIMLTQQQQKLVEDNVRLVYHVFKNLGETEFVFRNKDDICSEGMFGLVKAAQKFNGSKGIKFATFAARCIWNEMLMFIRRNKKFQNEVSLYAPLNADAEGNVLQLIDIIDDGGAGAEACEAGLVLDGLTAFKKTLNSDQLRMFEMRAAGYKQRQIADEMGLSQSYVSRVLGKIKRQYKKLLVDNG